MIQEQEWRGCIKMQQKLSLIKKISLFLVYLIKQPFREVKYFFILIVNTIKNLFSSGKDVKNLTSIFRQPRKVFHLVAFILAMSILIDAKNEVYLINFRNKMLLLLMIVSIIWKEWVSGKFIEEYRKKEDYALQK